MSLCLVLLHQKSKQGLLVTGLSGPCSVPLIVFLYLSISCLCLYDGVVAGLGKPAADSLAR